MLIHEVKALFNQNLYNLILCDNGKNKKYYTLSSIIDKYNEYGLINGEENNFVYRNISYIIKFNKTICGLIFINIDKSEYSMYDVHGGIKYINENIVGFSANTKNDIKIYNFFNINDTFDINYHKNILNKTIKLPEFIHCECKKVIDQYLLLNEIFNE